MPNRPAYDTDCSDEEWAFAASYLALVRQDAPQRKHDLRQVFDAVRWIGRALDRPRRGALAPDPP